MFEIKIIGII